MTVPMTDKPQFDHKKQGLWAASKAPHESGRGGGLEGDLRRRWTGIDPRTAVSLGDGGRGNYMSSAGLAAIRDRNVAAWGATERMGRWQ